MTTMREFGSAQTTDRLEDAAKAIRKAAAAPEEDAVHKMRVAIRRLQQSLRLFEQFFRTKGVKQVRRDLKAIMTTAGEVRNFDIAISLGAKRASFRKPLQERRHQAQNEFLAVLGGVGASELPDRWKSKLELS
ncbi:MAG: CHAD domain-containing protein [Bryobacteraceae bacterium]|nr:CHAD domain-containing protein [Bryobacteraceae bacterium]